MKFSRFVYALERNGENYATKSPPLNQKQDKILGGLFGLLIGDALGVPYEFYPPEQLPAYQDIEMQPPGRPLGRHGKRLCGRQPPQCLYAAGTDQKL